MKITWICGARRFGGAETATFELMRRLCQRTHLITVLCPVDSPVARAAHDVGLAVRSATIGRELDPRTWVAVAALLRADAPDIALVSTMTEWMPACLARRSARTALVLVRHMALPLSRRVRWIAQRRADAIVAVSAAVRDVLCRDGLPPADQVPVIHNPIRFAAAASPGNEGTRRASRLALGIDPTARWVAFCGGLDVKKGVGDVVEAVRIANRALPGTRLLICGARATGAERILAAEHVTYLGEVDQIDAVYRAADLVVMATRRALSEALPATLLEAMACGTPVAGYATGGIAEVIGTDGEAGRLAKADDVADLARVITEVVQAPAGSTQMAMRALTRVRTVFDADRIVDAYEELFTRLLAARG